MGHPRVFVSYSHDSDAHSEAVLQLGQHLREWGIDVHLDRFVPDPPEGWPRWMMTEVGAADFVLLVCTAGYRRRLEGLEEPGKGKGVTFEGLLAIQHLYDASTRNTKFVPVVFEGVSDADVPQVLRPYTRYCLPGQFVQLYRRLTDQPEIVAAPLGPRKTMPPRRASSPVVATPGAAGPTASGPDSRDAAGTTANGDRTRPGLGPAQIHSAGGLDVAVTPLEALRHLLLGLFVSGEEFRQWVARGPDGPRLVADLPGGMASTMAILFSGLDVLERRGYLDHDFFHRLRAEFERRREDIDRVAAAWHSRPSC